jgi:hypothetical protein
MSTISQNVSINARFMLRRKLPEQQQNREDEFEIRQKPITRRKNTSPALSLFVDLKYVPHLLALFFVIG